jgi:acyl-CoA reductase-like NAD-dependent aldehyde dehydrogenase
MGETAAERTQTNGTGTNGHGPAMIKSYAPATGELIGEVPVMGEAEVRAAVARARAAQKAWGALPIEERCDQRAAASRTRSSSVGRGRRPPRARVRQAQARGARSRGARRGRHRRLLRKHAPRSLAPREVPLHLMKHRKAVLHYMPRGVVGVISPWNFPFQLPLRDVVMALIAGNAAVLKPSEVTPLIALKAKQIWDEAGLPADLFQVVTGYGPTGAALIDSGIQFLVFTGGVSTGKRVAAACGERLIPCVMELGGKAPFIACADIDIERTARGIVYGGFTNCGQVCIAVERVYAHREIHDRLLDRVVELTRELRQGRRPSKDFVDVGAIIFAQQMDIAEKHIADAVAKGARVETGGKRRPGPGQFFEPTVLSNCDHSMTVMTGEIFGPVVPFMSVGSDEEAVRLANESHLGLNAYVFSGDREHGKRVAERVEAGSVLVNDVLINGGMPEAPFGGIKQSGFGRVMGDESLREMCDVRHVSESSAWRCDGRPPLVPLHREELQAWFKKGMRVLFGGGSVFDRIKGLFLGKKLGARTAARREGRRTNASPHPHPRVHPSPRAERSGINSPADVRDRLRRAHARVHLPARRGRLLPVGALPERREVRRSMRRRPVRRRARSPQQGRPRR